MHTPLAGQRPLVGSHQVGEQFSRERHPRCLYGAMLYIQKWFVRDSSVLEYAMTTSILDCCIRAGLSCSVLRIAGRMQDDCAVQWCPCLCGTTQATKAWRYKHLVLMLYI